MFGIHSKQRSHRHSKKLDLLIFLVNRSRRLDVRLWVLKEYISSESVHEIIEVTQLRSLLGMQTVSVGPEDAKVWATVSQDHVR